jgi:hypothetical protein
MQQGLLPTWLAGMGSLITTLGALLSGLRAMKEAAELANTIHSF